MRAIWSGSLSFGLVNIPVKLFAATEESSLDFDMLDSKDQSNIKFKRVNEKTGKEVLYENIVKGYLVDDNYVILDKEDFVSADAVKTNTIDVQSFVSEDEIESIYYEQPYYLEPDKTGVRAYGILRDALKKAHKVGVTTFVMRNKEALAILKPYGNVIVLNRIRFEEEIRDYDDLKLPPSQKASSKEQQMAAKLIEQLTEKFDISQYKDTYTGKLLKIIKAKAKGKKPPVKTLKVVHTKSNDLMAALKASLETKRKAS